MQLVLLCVLVLSLLQPGLLQGTRTEDITTNEDGGDLSQSIRELKDIVLDLSREVRGQLATINATVNSHQGHLESLAEEVVRNTERISQNTSLQLATTTDQLSTELNQLRRELTANQQTINLVHNRIEAELLQGQRNVQNKLHSIDERMEYYYRYTCGGSPGWRRVAFLNMTDPSQDCPSGWNLTTHSVRTCGRLTSSEQNTCDPVTFPVSGGEYSRVCGRITAYQYGAAWAFRGSLNWRRPLDGYYVDGISITHGQPRQHIWTFAAGLAQDNSGRWSLYLYCYCDVQTYPNSYRAIPPSFVGNDYFCEAGESGHLYEYRLYSENPLWDGEGCGQNSTCCSMNNPPYFMKDLPAPTTDDVEVRICSNYYRQSEYPVELLEIYVQ